MLSELGARHQHTGAVHQVVQHFVLMAREADRLAITRDAATAGIQLQGSTLQHGRSLAAGPADQRPQARQQFLHMEGFGEVVVRASVDACHFFVPVVAGGEDQHRHAAPAITPALQHRKPVHHGQTQIQHHTVERFGVTQKLGVKPVVGFVHRVARIRQGRAELRAQGLFVFNQQDAHGFQRRGRSSRR